MPVMSLIFASRVMRDSYGSPVGSLVECGGANARRAVAVIMYGYSPWLAANGAVLDVFLNSTPARVEADVARLAAVRTDHDTARICRAVAEWKVAVEIKILIVRAVAVIRAVWVARVAEHEAHGEMYAGAAAGRSP